MSREALNTGTHSLADEPTLADGPPTYSMAISLCYSHLLIKNGHFTLLLTSSVQEWQFHIATDSSSGQEWQLHIATVI